MHRKTRQQIRQVHPDDARITSDVSQYIFTAPIVLAFEGGYEGYDTMPVLIGPKGVGKSEFLRFIFPEEHRDEWYGLVQYKDIGTRKFIEEIKGKVICEVTGLADCSGGDILRAESFMRGKRKVLLVATVEDDSEIPKDSYDRFDWRFAPVYLSHRKMSRKEFRDSMDRDRGQLLAEARHNYKQGDYKAFIGDKRERLKRLADRRHAETRGQN